MTSSELFASNSGWSAPLAFGVSLNGVMSTALFSFPASLIVAVWTMPGV